MTSIFLAQTASFVSPPYVDTVFQNGLKADWDVTITLQRDLNLLFKDYKFAVPVSNHGNEVNDIGDGKIEQGVTSYSTNQTTALSLIDSIKRGWDGSSSVMYDTSYDHLKDNVNRTTLRDNMTVALIALFTNGVLSLGDVRNDLKDLTTHPPIRIKVRKVDGTVQSVGAIDISLLLPKGCSVIGGALDEWLTKPESTPTSWYNQVLVQQQVDEILADIVLFQRFSLYGMDSTLNSNHDDYGKGQEVVWVATDSQSTNNTLNPHPTDNGGGFYQKSKLNSKGDVYLVASDGTYNLDPAGQKQINPNLHCYTTAEMYGKLDLKDLDRIGVLVSVVSVLQCRVLFSAMNGVHQIHQPVYLRKKPGDSLMMLH